MKQHTSHHVTLTDYPISVPLPENASPAIHEKRTLVCGDGVQLHLHLWRPSEDIVGVVVFMHGIGMHGAPYEAIASGFTSRGLVLACPDLRGHGSSSGRRSVFPRRRQLLEDGDAVLALLAGEYPEVPLFMAGESMGGLVAAEYARARQDRLVALVLMVPAFQVHPSRFLARQDLGLLLRKARSFLDSEENLSVSSRDEGFIRAKIADPLVTHSVHISYLLRLGWMGVRWFWIAASLRLPLLMLLAGKDQAISNTMAQRVYRSIGTPADHKQLRIWGNAYHTVCWDPDAPEIIDTAVSWILEWIEKE